VRSPVFEYVYSVSPDDIDDLGHVNNLVYLRWVQDVATRHWEAVADLDLRGRVVWVVVRHEIEYRSSALLRDRVVARTWVEGGTRTLSDRHTELCREADGTVLARATTSWCPLNPEDRRPLRVRDCLPPGLVGT